MLCKPWIFAFSVAYFGACQASNQPCKTAIREMLELKTGHSRGHNDLMMQMTRILNPHLASPSPNASVEAAPDQAATAISALCPQFNETAQAVEKVIGRCFYHDRCPQYEWKYFAPDVYRAMAKVCENTEARELIGQLQAIVPCWKSLAQRWRDSNVEDDEVTRPVFRLLTTQWESFENLTVSCGPLCGRKCSCRRVQIAVPFHTHRPNANIVEVCGQYVHDVVLELQERILDVLDCNEFGDYEQEWGWLKVKYQATKERRSIFNDLTFESYGH